MQISTIHQLSQMAIKFEREVGIVIKSKETSSQHKSARNGYVTIMHQPVTVSSNICSQMHVQIKHSLVHPQDLIHTLAGIKYISNNTNQSSN